MHTLITQTQELLWRTPRRLLSLVIRHWKSGHPGASCSNVIHVSAYAPRAVTSSLILELYVYSIHQSRNDGNETGFVVKIYFVGHLQSTIGEVSNA